MRRSPVGASRGQGEEMNKKDNIPAIQPDLPCNLCILIYRHGQSFLSRKLRGKKTFSNITNFSPAPSRVALRHGLIIIILSTVREVYETAVGQ